MPPRYDLRSQKNIATSASITNQSNHSNQVAIAAIELSVTIRALQAIMNSFKLEMRAMKDRINSKIVESRSRSFSPAPQQLSSPLSSNQVT